MTPTHMSTASAPALDRVAIGRARVEARGRRRRAIRRRVAAWAGGLFAAAWLGIAVQLVSGHDPALARASTQTSTVSSPSTAASTAASTSTGASSVTTRQS